MKRNFLKHHLARLVFLICLYFCTSESAFAGKGEWGTIVDGLQCRIWFYGAEPIECKREQSLHVKFEIQNISDHEIIIARKHIGSEFFPFFAIHLKDPNGIERICTPWYKPETGFPSYWPLKVGEIVHWNIDLQVATQAHQWDWWEGFGFPPGDYEIHLVYQYPNDLLNGELSPSELYEYEQNEEVLSVWRREQARNDKEINVWHGELSTKSRGFTILKESSYGAYHPAEENAKILSHNKFGFPEQVVYLKEGKTVRERYYSTDDYTTRYYLNFEMLYDNPTIPAKWQRASMSVSTLSVTTGFNWWHPFGNNATGVYRMWSPHPFGNGYFNQIAQAYYKDGKLEGEFTFQGHKGQFVDGKKHGQWTEEGGYFGNYKHGLLHGTQKQFYRGGEQLRQEEHYENGIQIGSANTWYSNGKLKEEGQYQQGKKNGRFQYYSENGQVVSIENYNMDVPDGTWTWFDQNGEVKAKGTWRDGKQHSGTFIDIFNPITGRVIILTTFQEGNKVESHPIELSNSWLWPSNRNLGR